MSAPIVSLLEGPRLATLETSLNTDPDFQAAAKGVSVEFAYKALESTDLLSVRIIDGSVKLNTGPGPGHAAFTLSARSQDWQELLASIPKAPFQSYWGILRQHGNEPGCQILGDVPSFGRNARLWRLVLDHARDVINETKTMQSVLPDSEIEEQDSIVGRYTWIETAGWGKGKIFYESSGTGPQNLLFLHTAGADSRQYHSLMNNKILKERCTMYAFDLPGHGRSDLGSKQVALAHQTEEQRYLDSIAQVIKKLKIKDVIACGASMAGHVCLAIAMRAAELGVIGVIPCEACDHLPFQQPNYELSGDLNESILNPERVCGMTAPTSPAWYKRNIWWTYSSQGAKIFSGDLEFYFRGWDGRDRLHLIDTKVCPVYMLTGEYDYSCTPAKSAETAGNIKGAVFTTMFGLGHFPATENPTQFCEYLLKGLDFIQDSHKNCSKSS